MSEITRDEWLTVRQITEELKVHEETARRWIRQGDLPAILLGSAKGGYRVRRSDFDRFIDERFGTQGKAAPVAA
jgi:excisionase family DNA binding protein